MDPRGQKLRLALGIMAAGMALGEGWACGQGWVLGRSYPFNTILYLPSVTWSDFTAVMGFCVLPSPYQDPQAVYPPGAYILLRPLAFGNNAAALFGLMGLTLYLVVVLQATQLLPLFRSFSRACLAALALSLVSYPVWFCLDRGNTEIVMSLLVGAALALINRRHFKWAALLLGITIVMKLYPAVLLVLLFRRKHIGEVAWTLAGAAIFSLLSLASFAGTMARNLALWGQSFAFYNQRYLMENSGLAGSSSGWNLVKIVYLTWAGVRHGEESAQMMSALPTLLLAYKCLYLALMAGCVFLALLIEREFFRRAVLLLFIVATSAPSGGDYKLIFVQVALFVLILIPTKRRHDLGAIALLALCIVPKKEFLLSYLGKSDSGFADVAVSVVTNPLLLLVAAALLAHDAWVARIPGWGWKRLEGLRSLILHPPWRELLPFRS
jgi:hypothetical protein